MWPFNRKRLTLDIKWACFVDGSGLVRDFTCVLSTIASRSQCKFQGLVAGQFVNPHVMFTVVTDWFSIMEPGYLSEGAGEHLANSFHVCVHVYWPSGTSNSHDRFKSWTKILTIRSALVLVYTIGLGWEMQCGGEWRGGWGWEGAKPGHTLTRCSNM